MTENSPDLFLENLSMELQSDVSLEDLPLLLSFLDNKDKRESLPQTLHSLLGSMLQMIPLSEMEHQLLQHVLPATKIFFSQVVLEINSSLKSLELQTSGNITDIVDENLQIGIDLLESVHSLLTHLSSFGKVKVNQVASVPMNVVEILLETFRHCKASEHEYGEVLSHMRNKLVSFFQKGHQIQISFLSFLHDNLVFACNYEDDLELLTKVMEHLSTLGEVIGSLDIKSMVEQWKGYTRLAQTYALYLRPVLNVAQPIRFLCENIVSHLSKLIVIEHMEEDEKQVRRNMKICSLELKIVIKMCELYQDYLGDCHQQLLILLLHLNMCLPSYLMYKNVTPPLSDDIEKQLFIGALPLLSHLSSDKEFIKVYTQYAKTLHTCPQQMKLAFLLLTISITKKIVRVEEELQNVWLQSMTILVIIISALHHCHDILCLDVFIEGDKTIDIYEALLISTTVLICNLVKSSAFPQLEGLLMSQLMKPYLWPATFASDLIVLVCRFGSSELCFNLTQQICEVIVGYNKDKMCPQWMYITKTVGRLFRLLTTNDKLNFLQHYPPTHNVSLWKYLPLTELPSEEKKRYCLNIVQKTNSAIYNFFNSSPDVDTFNSMVDSLSMAENCISSIASFSEIHHDVTSRFTMNIFQLWQCMAVPKNMTSLEASVSGLQWFYNLFSTLVSVSVPLLSYFDNYQLSFMLQCVSDICKAGASFCRLAAVQLLRGLSTTRLTKDQDQSNVFYKISSLFATLLTDSDPLIKALSLEGFEYFSSVTSHEVIVSETVTGNLQLQNLIAQFLQRLPLTHTSVSEENYLLSQNNTFKHKCDFITASQDDISKISIETVSECQNSVTNTTLERILSDTISMIKYFKENKASVQEQTLLKYIFQKMDKLKQTDGIEHFE